MKITQIILSEFRRLFATNMSRLALLALAIVPLLYGGVYLWANQDPYSNLSHIPVALVVQDQGDHDGADKFYNFGQDVANKLIEEKVFDWHSTNELDAERGIKDGTYDFIVTLPSDFTTKLLSVAHPNPQPAPVIITTNDANSYLATTIGSHAAEKIKTTITQLVNEAVSKRLLDAIQELRNGIEKAHDGSGQLIVGTREAATGSAKLASGLTQLDDGAKQLPDKTKQLANGANQVSFGAQQVATGAGKMNDASEKLENGAGELHNGSKKLAAGAQQVAEGNQKIADLADKTGTLVKEGADLMPVLRQGLISRLKKQGLSDTQINEILEALAPVDKRLKDNLAKAETARQQVDKLAAGANQVAVGAKTLENGLSQLHEGAKQLNSGTQVLNQGSQELAIGAKRLADGTGLLAGAAPQLANGINQASAGSQNLNQGLEKIDDGMRQLHDKMGEGLTKVTSYSDSERASQAQGISKPVVLNTHEVASAGSYGAGLAPFFLSLASWIGMYALMLIMKPVSKRAITALRSPVRVGIAGWLTPSLMGILQACALYAVVALALRFQIHKPFYTLLFMMLTCVTYAAIIVALNVWLGAVGQFLGLVLMVLQLVTAGGTFPWQTLPAPLAWLHRCLPMSYSVDGMRQLMYGGSMRAAYVDIIFLTVVLLLSLTIIVVGVAKQVDHRTLRDLQPSLMG